MKGIYNDHEYEFGYLELGNDTNVYWEYFGDGTKEAIALMNGVAMYTKSWYMFLEHLLDEYDVILYDFLGQGSSTSKDNPYSMEKFCDYLTMIIDHLEIDKIHIMGISFGGMVALDYARKYQHRLYSCTVSGVMLSDEELYALSRENYIALLKRAPFGVFTNVMYREIFGEKFVKNVRPLFDDMKDKLESRYKDRMYSLVRLIECQEEYFNRIRNNIEEFKAIETPTLIMCGAEDTLLPPWVQEKIAQILPNSYFTLVQDSGHVVYLEQSGFFFKTMKKFMKDKTYVVS